MRRHRLSAVLILGLALPVLAQAPVPTSPAAPPPPPSQPPSPQSPPAMPDPVSTPPEEVDCSKTDLDPSKMSADGRKHVKEVCAKAGKKKVPDKVDAKPQAQPDK